MSSGLLALASTESDWSCEPRSTAALVDLGEKLAERGYRFTAITPSSHAVVNARAGNELAHDLEGIFGWNRPFALELLPHAILAAARLADVLEAGPRFARSRVRFSTLGEALLLHSAFPTTSRDAVFFGPDSYRFVRLVADEVAGGGSLLELGCGTGAAALSLCDRFERVVMTDVNPLAVRCAHANAQMNARLTHSTRLEIRCGDLFAGAEGCFDAIIANPPFMIDAEHRLYRDGGPRGFELALRMLRESLPRLAPGGRLVLYTGVPYRNGHSAFHREIGAILGTRRFRCEELDVDVFGDELARAPYADVDRLAVIALIVDGAEA